MHKFDEVTSLIQCLRSDILQLSKYSSLNELAPFFYVQNKMVFETEKGIVRLTSRSEAEMRILVYKFALQNNVQCFLPEELLEEFSDDMFGVTLQEKIKRVGEFSEGDILTGLTKAEKDFLEEHKFLWYGTRNCGMVDGKIKIFDYTANFACRQLPNKKYVLLGRGKGEILIEG